MKVTFIRHGKTKGNIEKRYIGKTNEDLDELGILEIQNKKNEYPDVDLVISSGLKRCIQTATIIYGNDFLIYEDFNEFDFGDFENKNYEELKNNHYYKKWLESNGTLSFPNGEKIEDFKNRCVLKFQEIINKYFELNKDIAFVVHGGTIMAILDEFADENKSFFDWQIKNAEFLSFEVLKNQDEIKLE